MSRGENISPSVKSFPLTSALVAAAGLSIARMTEPSELSHCKVGVVTRNSTTLVVHVIERASPAVVRGGEKTVMTRGGRPVQGGKMVNAP